VREKKSRVKESRKRLRKAHRAVRGEHREERTEDYVETIYRRERKGDSSRIVDLQKVFGVSHVTVIRALQKLENDGFVVKETGGVILTGKGRNLGERCYERHRLVEAFLGSLGVSKETAAKDAEGIEHHLSPETLEAIRSVVGKAEIKSGKV